MAKKNDDVSLDDLFKQDRRTQRAKQAKDKTSDQEES